VSDCSIGPKPSTQTSPWVIARLPASASLAGSLTDRVVDQLGCGRVGFVDEDGGFFPWMVGDQAAAQDTLEQRRISRDRELDPDRRDSLDLARYADRGRRAGQRPELLDAGRRPPGGVVVAAEHERHLLLHALEHGIDVVRRNERRDPIDGPSAGHRHHRDRTEVPRTSQP